MRTKIKICGLFRLWDAEYVNEAVPDFAGFVFYPKSRRFVTDEQAASLRERILPSIRTVGVFVDETPEHIARLFQSGVIGVIQLHGNENEAYLSNLRRLLPGAEIWKAFKIRIAADLSAAEKSGAERVLLDNGYGTGNPFDWSLADSFGREMILAGGLTPQNIPDAVVRFHPWAVDLSSGVETGGVKDREKIMAAVAAVKEHS